MSLTARHFALSIMHIQYACVFSSKCRGFLVYFDLSSFSNYWGSNIVEWLLYYYYYRTRVPSSQVCEITCPVILTDSLSHSSNHWRRTGLGFGKQIAIMTYVQVFAPRKYFSKIIFSRDQTLCWTCSFFHLSQVMLGNIVFRLITASACYYVNIIDVIPYKLQASIR